jgi:eukaryotic-like serine/threonine-protein kinase
MKCPSCQTDNPSDSRFCKQCAAPLPSGTNGALGRADASLTRTLSHALRELTAGSTFAGRYQIVEELGHGGMGRVYKAVDTQVNEKVALKLLKPEISADSEMIERFRNELKLARRIAHRNICRMFDLGEAEGTRFITMEFVPGEDLRTVIRMTGSLAVGTILSIGQQVADGLAEAHGLGIVHRDLKPQNVMIDTAGRVKIMDFGIARSVREKGVTGPGVMIGTPEYMSPEQVEAKETDARSDIYSLGIILYEMATGRVPFEGDTALSIAMKQKGETPKSPKALNPNLPDELSAIILRCLEKDPAKRFASAADLRAELERVEMGLPTTERVAAATQHRPFTSKEITVKFTLRKAILPAAAVLAIVGGIVAWQLVRLNKARAVPAPPAGKPSLAIVTFENISGDPSLDDWRSGLPELLGTDLSQSKFLTVLSGETTFGILKKLGLSEAKKLSAEDLGKIATAGRVEYILSGGIMKAGPKIILTARLQRPAKGEVVETKKVECAGEEEIPSRVDELTRMVKADLNLSPKQIAGDIDKAVGQITTSSPEALKFYFEARKRHLALNQSDSIPLYEKAIALDPGFAMAYRSLAAVYSNQGFVQKSRECIQKAVANADRISDRERLLIQGRLYQGSERTYPQAIKTYEELVKLYPDEYVGWNGLAVIYSALGDEEKTIPYNERAYALNKDALTCGNLAGAHRALGRSDRAREIYEDFLRTAGESARIRVALGYLALAEGRIDDAVREADKALIAAPDSVDAAFLKSDIDVLRGDFAAAEKACRNILERGAPRDTIFARVRLVLIQAAQGRLAESSAGMDQLLETTDRLGVTNVRASSLYYSAYLDWWAGRLDRASAKIDSALKIFREMDLWPNIRNMLLARGRVQLERGRLDQAVATARELHAFIEQGLNKRAVRLADLLDGEIEIERGNTVQGIALIERAVSLLNPQAGLTDEHAGYLNALAMAYEKAGDRDKARATYEKIAGLTTARLMGGYFYALAFFKLGEIAEKRGDAATAKANYGKFLELWKNADPGRPEVAAARKRLAALR